MATFHNGVLRMSRVLDYGMMIEIQTGIISHCGLIGATCLYALQPLLLQNGKGWADFFMMLLKVMAKVRCHGRSDLRLFVVTTGVDARAR